MLVGQRRGYATKFNTLEEAVDFYEREKLWLMTNYSVIRKNTAKVVIVKVTEKEKEGESL